MPPVAVTDQEIQQEIESLRSLRRRSHGPGSLTLDPDLPPPPVSDSAPLDLNSQSSPTRSHRSGGGSPTSPTSRRQHQQQVPWSPGGSTGSGIGGVSGGFGSEVLRVRSRSNDSGGVPILGPIVEASSSSSSSHHPPRPSGPREPSSPTSSSSSTRGGAHNSTPSPVPQESSSSPPVADNGEDSPAHLFWVPAHLHPELAPGEFRAFLKAHTHADPLGDGSMVGGQGAVGTDPDAVIASDASGIGMARSPSWLARRGSLGRGTSSLAHATSSSSSSSSLNGSGNVGLGRKRSMLSRQYHPRPGDNVEDEQPPVPSLDLHRSSSSSSSSSIGRPTSIYGGLHGDEGVTLADLQKLEQLADEASDDPAKMRSLLRRTLSTKVLPDMEEDRAIGYNVDENDVPILVPPPGQILRRTARTKIRKVGLAGDGGGHRFGPSRKGRTAIRTEEQELQQQQHETIPSVSQQNIEDDMVFDRGRRPSDGATGRGDGAASDDDEMYSAESGHSRDRFEEQPSSSMSYLNQRRPSDGSTEESAIYDSYADTSVESSVSSVDFSTTDESSSTDPSQQQHIEHRDAPQTDQYIDWDHERTPTSTHSNDAARNMILGRTPGAAASPPSSPETIRKGELYAPTAHAAPAPPPKKEKEKKGGFFSKSKDKKTEVKSAGATKKEKEKDGFLGGLFSSKKKVEEPAPAPLKFSEAGRQTAAALLGSSKSAKSLGLAPMGVSPTSPGFSPYARYPIHVERAVYRLSHIKLANPRRPLYEQVLISNLMFWYLSVINRAQTTGGSGTSPNATQTEDRNKPKASSADDDAESAAAAAANNKVGGGTPPRPAEEYRPKNARPPQPAPVRQQAPEPATPPPPPQAKRNPLSKPERARGSEQVVRPPQYGMQNLQIEKEYRQPSNRGPPPPQQQAPSPPPPPPSVQHVQQPPASPRRQPSPQPAPPSQRSSAAVREPAAYSAPAREPAYAPPPQMYPNYNSRQPEPQQHPPATRAAPSVRPPPIQTQQSAPRPLPQHDVHHPPPPSSAGSTRSQQQQQQQRTPQSPSKPSGFPHDSGPRPGEVFQWPVSAKPRPGQPYPSPSSLHGPQPGQVFVHPQYTNNGPYPPPQQQQQQQGRPPPQPQQEMRLPPGAAPPRHAVGPPAGSPGWTQAPPPHQYQQQPQSHGGRPTVDQGRRAASGPPSVDPYASDVYAPQQHAIRSVSAGGPPPAPPVNGAYNPYVRQQSPPNGDRRYEDPRYRQQQQPSYPVPNGQYYGGERR